MTTGAAQSGIIIETVAGDGEPGYAGDGGLAVAASLNEPKGLCVDAQGNLYIADSENHVVRRVDRGTGLITTVAGSEPAGKAGPVPPPEPTVVTTWCHWPSWKVPGVSRVWSPWSWNRTLPASSETMWSLHRLL